MHVTFDNFETAIAALPVPQPIDPKVVQTLKLLYKILDRDESFNGGCYMVTAMSHILLNEQGIESTPCIGDAVCDRGPFDHAWLEIGGAVFDLPIQYPMDPKFKMPAIIGGFHFGGQASRVLYGTDPSSYGKQVVVGDGTRGLIQSMSLGLYLSGAEGHGLDLWGIIKVLSNVLGLNLDKAALKKKYLSTHWTLRDSVQVPEAMTRGWMRIC